MAQTYSLWQAVDAAVQLSVRAIEEVRALSRQPGPPGEPGKDGAPGQLPITKEWTDRVYDRAETVTRDGNLYQALKQTGKEPGHPDWQLLVPKGEDGRSWTIRDTYDPDEQYRAFDVVTVNATWFAARKITPARALAPIGSQARAARRARQARRARRAPKGERGADGASIIGGSFDAREMKLVLERSDGGVVAVDMYDFALALKGA